MPSSRESGCGTRCFPACQGLIFQLPRCCNESTACHEKVGGEIENDPMQLAASIDSKEIVYLSDSGLQEVRPKEEENMATCEILVRSVPREIIAEPACLIRESWQWLRCVSMTGSS